MPTAAEREERARLYPWEVARSQGSIFYREARAAYVVKFTVRKGEPPKSFYVPGPRTKATYALADSRLAGLITAREKGERVNGRTMTVAAWLATWMETKLDLKKGTSDDAYADRIALYLEPTLGDKRLGDLQVEDVERAMGLLLKGGYMRRGGSKTRSGHIRKPGRAAPVSVG